jgi:hypothetical protein
MRIVGAEWAPASNVLRIACGCGEEFLHSALRWKVVCPACKASEPLHYLRHMYMEENK